MPVDPEGTLFIVQMKDVNSDSGIDWSGLTRMNPVSLREPDYLKHGDVIFCGRGTRIFAVPVTINPEKAVAASQFFVLTPTDNAISASYLSWYINSKPAQRYFWTNAAGSSIINVTRIVLENLPVLIPSPKDMITAANLIKAINREKELALQLCGRRQQLLETIISEGLEER